MADTLTQWDKAIAPHLASIRLDCGWVRHYVDNIIRHCSLLMARPEWETLAEDELDKTISHLKAVVEQLENARDIYQGKPQT